MSKLTRTPQPKLAESDRREKLPSKSSGVDKGASPLAASNTRTHGKDAHGDHKEKMEAKPKAEKAEKTDRADKEAVHHGAHKTIAIDKSEAKVDGHEQLASNAEERRSAMLNKERGTADLHNAVKHLKIPTDCSM